MSLGSLELPEVPGWGTFQIKRTGQGTIAVAHPAFGELPGGRFVEARPWRPNFRQKSALWSVFAPPKQPLGVTDSARAE